MCHCKEGLAVGGMLPVEAPARKVLKLKMLCVFSVFQIDSGPKRKPGPCRYRGKQLTLLALVQLSYLSGEAALFFVALEAALFLW